MNKLIFMMATLSFLLSCQKKKETSMLDQNGFNLFYNRFHSDSLFQMNHITFPLAGKFEDSVRSFWQQENWKQHNLEHFDTSLFEHKFSVVDSLIVIERFDHKKYPYKVERRFAKLNNEWKLIYYFAP